MSRSSKQAKRLIAYMDSQFALGVPIDQIYKAAMSRPIAELEAEAEAKAAAASAAAAGATAPSGTPSTPPTLPASPPLGTPPTLPALPPSGTPPTLPPLPPSGNATLSGTPSTPPHPGTPGSSFFNNWYEEIEVSGLSNSTPCVSSKALVVIQVIHDTNSETEIKNNGNQPAEEVELLELDSDTNSLTPTVTPPPTTTSSKIRSSTPSEFQAPDLGAPNAPQSNNSTLLKTCSVNENHNTNYGFYLPEFSKALTVLPTGSIEQWFYKDQLLYWIQRNTQTQTSNSTPFIHIYDLIKNAPSSKFNNITNSTNVTTLSETPSTTPSKIQILSTNNYSHDFTNSNDLPTNNTESDHDSFTSNNLYKLLGDTSSHFNSNIKFTPLGTALVVYRPFEMNYSLSEEVRKILPRSNVDISTNHTQSESNNITNSTNVTTLSETHSTTPFEVQILADSTADSYNVIKNTSTNNYSHDFTNSNDLPTNNTESDHDSFTSNNLYKLLGDTSSHFNSNIKFTPLGTALVVYRPFEMNYSLSEEVRKILPRSNVDISTNHTQSESNNITNSTNVTTLSETHSTTLSKIQILANSTDDSYNVIKNTSTNNYSHDFTNSNDLPTNNTESDHDSFTSNNLYELLGYTSSHFNSNIKIFTPLGTALVVYRQFEMNYSLSEVVRKILTESTNDIKNTPSFKCNNITNSTSVNMNEDEQQLRSLPLNTLDHKLFFQSYSLIPQLITTTRIDEYLVDNTTLDNNITPNESPYNINYGQSKSTCLDGIDYINAPTASTLKSNLECFAKHFNSTQECIIHMWEIKKVNSNTTYAPNSCDMHQGTTKVLCKSLEQSCNSIKNIHEEIYGQCHQAKDYHKNNTYLIDQFCSDFSIYNNIDIINGHENIVSGMYCGFLSLDNVSSELCNS